MLLEVGRAYCLEPVGFAARHGYTHTIPHAIYMGAYDALDGYPPRHPRHPGNRESHRFVHLVHDRDYMDFAGCWPQIASNRSWEEKRQYDGQKSSVTVFDTHVWDALIAGGDVRITSPMC